MSKKNQNQQQPHIFEVGDLVSDQKHKFKVILKVMLDHYEFMILTPESWNTANGIHTIRKGDISFQPFFVFDKYNYLYNPNL